MKKTAIALLLALFLIIAPMSLPAQSACLEPKVVNGITVCADSPLDPLIEPLIPPELKPEPSPSPTRPPSNGGGTNGGGSSSGGSQDGSGGSKATSPRTAQPTPSQRKAAAAAKKKAEEEKKAKAIPTPKSTEPAVANPEIEYRFETYPWYFWVTIIFGILGVGFLLFYDTDPDRKNYSVIDKIKRRVLK